MQISDLSPLTELNNLKELDLSGNNITEISPLGKLLGLEILMLNYNKISDLSPLSNLESLKELDLSGNSITEISPLGKLLGLEILKLDYNEISDLCPLSNLESLKELDLSGNGITKISPLGKLLGLEILKLKYNKISDLSPLSNLESLKELDLDEESISSISPLPKIPSLENLTIKNLTIKYRISYDISTWFSERHLVNLNNLENLRELDSSENRITDISSLAKFSGLQKLYLNRNWISDLSPLTELNNLKELDLSRNSITDISPLANLLGLEILMLYHNKISDLSPLSNLESLKELDLSGNCIRDISPLSNLKCLKELDLSGNGISDISSFAKLKSLKILKLYDNKISDLSPLSSLESLKELNLSKNGISDISSIAKLKSLKILKLYDNKISDLKPLSKLESLIELDISDNHITSLKLENLICFPNIKSLVLNWNPIKNIPKEIIAPKGGMLGQKFNVLSEVRAYLEDLEKGAQQNNEVKVILIGNGSVGKTQIAKRLSERDNYNFPTDHKSTHGISLLQASLKSEVYQSDLLLNLWDLGGQDLFHAAHRVFMQTRALILLVWDVENEIKDFHNWEGKEYKNHKLRYWLAYAELFAPTSPVLVLENKVDNSSESNHLPEPEKRKLQREFSNIVGFLNCSAKTGNNFDLVELEILETLENHPIIKEDIIKVKLPTVWVSVRDQIRKLQQPVRGVKELEKEEFQILCKDEGIEDSTNTLLGYLHDTGVLYYQKNYFNDKIIIDQAWAISAVYELFNRSNSYAELIRIKNSAKLYYQDICKIWPKHTDQEMELFMSFLKSAELCYEDNFDRLAKFETKTFIVPQLLAEERPAYIDDYIEAESLSEKYSEQYKLIPSSFIHRFIVRAMSISEVNAMWQYGVFFDLNGKKAVVEITDSEDELLIHYSRQTIDIKEIILEELNNIKYNIPLNLGEGEMDTAREMILRGLERARGMTTGINQIESIMEKKEIKIFISFSSKDRDLMELLKDGLKTHLSQHPKFSFKVWSDKEINIGENWKEEIEMAMEESQAAVLLVSASFAFSEFINREELAVFFKKKKDEGYLVIPVLARN